MVGSDGKDGEITEKDEKSTEFEFETTVKEKFFHFFGFLVPFSLISEFTAGREK
ncbi:MAG: hypothetical protein V7750_13715 [Sneathiella sp.]